MVREYNYIPTTRKLSILQLKLSFQWGYRNLIKRDLKAFPREISQLAETCNHKDILNFCLIYSSPDSLMKYDNIFEFLLTDPRFQNRHSQSELVFLACQGEIFDLRLLFQHRTLTQQELNDGLYAAIQVMDIYSIRLFLYYGADVSCCNDRIESIGKRQPEVVKLLDRFNTCVINLTTLFE